MKRKLGQMIREDECFCIQFSDIPDIFCTFCNGTGRVDKTTKKFPKRDANEEIQKGFDSKGDSKSE